MPSPKGQQTIVPGQVYGNWTVLDSAEVPEGASAYHARQKWWLVRCSICKSEKAISSQPLRKTRTLRCFCDEGKPVERMSYEELLTHTGKSLARALRPINVSYRGEQSSDRVWRRLTDEEYEIWREAAAAAMAVLDEHCMLLDD